MIHSLVARLPEIQRDALALRFAAGLSSREIAPGGRVMVEYSAICAWYGDWTSAFRVGDKDRLARDRVMMGEILTWKTIADPFLADDSIRNEFRRLNSSADTGDPKPIDEYRTNNCSAS